MFNIKDKDSFEGQISADVNKVSFGRPIYNKMAASVAGVYFSWMLELDNPNWAERFRCRARGGGIITSQSSDSYPLQVTRYFDLDAISGEFTSK